jgi:hypothetical protein
LIKPPQKQWSKKMSRTLYATRDDPARRAKLDVITAAMLTGGASGGWGMARALKSQAARRIDTRPACAVGEVQAQMTVRSEPREGSDGAGSWVAAFGLL